MSTPRPTELRRTLLLLAAASVASACVLPWNLDAVTSLDGFTAACRRLGSFLAAFATPDLGLGMLQRCAGLAAETLALAVLGTCLGLAMAYPLALGSCRGLLLADGHHGAVAGPVRRLLLELCRLGLDALRGVPDFLWAIVLANFTGVNPVTGALAIAISTAGIFGKVLAEQWDNIEARRYEALRGTGAGAAAVFAYGMQPLAARAVLSFVLMRFECAVRNASVIGIFGGGGLGGALWDEYSDGNTARVATVLLALLAVTTVSDLAANLVRRQLRVDPNHPRQPRRSDRAAVARRRTLVATLLAGCLGLAGLQLAPALATAAAELQRIEWAFVREFTGSLAIPDLSPPTLRAVATNAAVPLAIGLLATLLAMLGAAAISLPSSVAFQLEAHRFNGERLGRLGRAARAATVLAGRGAALLCRGIPEVAWVMLLAVFFKTGITPCVFAIALHGVGVLGRVFTETIDNVPYAQLERAGAPTRGTTFLFAALPRALADWRTYTFFQFEVNVRLGVALGLVGAGGLGDRFDSNLKFRQFDTASTYLWAMVLLTVAIDRCSRWLQLRRNRC